MDFKIIKKKLGHYSTEQLHFNSKIVDLFIIHTLQIIHKYPKYKILI